MCQHSYVSHYSYVSKYHVCDEVLEVMSGLGDVLLVVCVLQVMSGLADEGLGFRV